MLRGLVICPDSELASLLDQSLAELNQVEVVRDLDHYPEEIELMRCVRAQAPHVVFLSTESVPNAIAVVQLVEREAPGLQLIAISKTCEPQVLLDLMRAGLREFLAAPFERQAIVEALSRAEEQAQKHPTITEATDQLYAFLPSKPGVGTSTVALNAAIALSRFPDTGVLLMDLDLTAGIIGFMLKLSTTHSVVDAAENAHQLDESNWPQLVARVGKMDVLHSGRLNPDPRLESAQIQYLLQFARRHYQAICVDLSGNLERYSLEIMQEAKKIFMVITPEIPSLHLAREKLGLLARMDLADRVRVLLNRSHKRSLVSAAQIEDLLRVPVMMNFSNDYQGVHRALQAGRSVDSDSELGKQFHGLARTILDRKVPETDAKKKSRGSIFSILPGYSAMGESKKSTV
jgi:pilus assembly protein CpaE